MLGKFLKKHPHIPNYITVSRLLVIPFLILILQFKGNTRWGCFAAAIIFLGASLTDLLDGYLARRYNLVSNLGRFLDPLADKLLMASALIMMIPLDRVPAWIAFLILAREIGVTGLRCIAAEQNIVISASSSGKQKTFAQSVAIFCLLWNFSFFGLNINLIGMVILYIALLLTYWSGYQYFRSFFKSFKN